MKLLQSKLTHDEDCQFYLSQTSQDAIHGTENLSCNSDISGLNTDSRYFGGYDANMDTNFACLSHDDSTTNYWVFLGCDPVLDCSGNGYCSGEGECICNPGWEGSHCTIPVCNGTTDSHEGCNGRGMCNLPDQCLCYDGDVFGPLCQYTCDCGGHGVCEHMLALSPTTSLISNTQSHFSLQHAQEFSISFWINATSEGNIFEKPGEYGIKLKDGAYEIYIHGNGGNFSSSIETVRFNRWQYVAFTYSSNNLTIYLDDNYAQSFFAHKGFDAEGLFTMGSYSANNGFSGYIQQLTFWKKALKLEQIRSIKDKHFNSVSPDLIYFLPLFGPMGANSISIYDSINPLHFLHSSNGLDIRLSTKYDQEKPYLSCMCTFPYYGDRCQFLRQISLPRNHALNFNGAMFLHLKDSHKMRLFSDFTYEFWIQFNSLEPQYIIGKHSAHVKYYEGLIVAFSDISNNVFHTPRTRQFEVNKWYHIAISFRTTLNGLRIYLYINGIREQTSQFNQISFINQDIQNSLIYIGGRDGLGKFSGYMNQVRIWNRYLDHIDVKNIMCSSQFEQFDSLIAQLSFDDTLLDSSGNGYDAEPSMGDVTFENIGEINSAFGGHYSNVCPCPSGVTGTFCDISTVECNSVDSFDDMVCNYRNGSCVDTNGGGYGNCICHEGYEGHDCESPICTGTPYCSNGGKCTAPDTCLCYDPDVRGANCEEYPFNYFLYGMGGMVEYVTQDISSNIKELHLSEEYPVQYLSASDTHMLILPVINKIFAYGSSEYGALGYDPGVSSSINLQDQDRIRKVDTGRDFSVILSGIDSILTSGRNNWGQLGRYTSGEFSSFFSQIYIEGDYFITDVCAGNDFVLATTLEGKLLMWGKNIGGFIDNLSGIDHAVYSPTEIGYHIEGDYTVRQISCGGEHVLVWVDQFHGDQHHSKILSMGNNNHGQLGDGTNEMRNSLETRIYFEIGKVKKIVASQNNSYILTHDSQLYCTGRNLEGQLGNQSLSDGTSIFTILAHGFEQIYDVSSKGSHVLLNTNEGIYGFGDNSQNQMGFPDHIIYEPRKIDGLDDLYRYTFIFAGQISSFFVQREYYCFGYRAGSVSACSGEGICIYTDTCICNSERMGIRCQYSLNKKNAPIYHLHFDGEKQFLKFQNSTQFANLSNYTLEFWVKFDTNDYETGVTMGSPSGFLWYVGGSAKSLRASYKYGDSLFGLPNHGDSYDDIYPNQWYHIAAIFENMDTKERKIRLYVDGLLVSETVRMLGNPSTETNRFLVGALMDHEGKAYMFFKGFLSELRIWGKSLDDIEVHRAMCSSVQIPEQGLFAYYSFDINGGLHNQIDDIPSLDLIYDSNDNRPRFIPATENPNTCGEYFHQDECHGIPSTHPFACSGNGDCISSQCICHEGYDGPACGDLVIGNNIFRLIIQEKGLNEAIDICNQEGFFLATIDSQEENSLILAYVKRLYPLDSIMPPYGILLGIDPKAKKWVNGGELSFENWDENVIFQDHGDHLCTMLMRNGYWSNVTCADSIFMCKKTKCFSIDSGDVNVCYGRGRCVSHDQCLCENGWTGLKCDIPVCYGINSSLHTACSGNGYCLYPNNCSCNNGYFGHDCNDTTCYGILSSNSSVCSSHGTCADKNICVCDAGFMGDQCDLFDYSQIYCNNISALGSDVCSNNGECISSENCRCKEGYMGVDCETAICFDIPSNSSEVCGGRGLCTGKNICECFAGYSGPSCSDFMCFSKNSSDPSVCSQKGTCHSPNVCQCFSGFHGIECEYTTCFGKISNDHTVCSSHGSCIQKDICICQSGFTGLQCEEPVCFGYPSHHENVCSGNGLCISNDTCSCFRSEYKGFYSGHNCSKCSNNYRGSDCLTEICDDMITCLGNGVCELDTLKCSCFHNDSRGHFTGDFCESCSENYFGSNCSTYCTNDLTCNSNGYCNEEGECVCFSNFEEATNCKTCKHGFFGTQCTNGVSSDFIFRNNGDGIYGNYILDYPSNVIDCSGILDPISLERMGRNPQCYWYQDMNGERIFTILFGENPTLFPGDRISLNVLPFSQNAHYVVVSTKDPKNPIIPIARVIAPTKIGICDGIYLDASLSSSLDRRDLKFSWNVAEGENKDILNQEYLSPINLQSRSTISIPENLVLVGNYTILIEVKNYLGAISSVNHTFVKVGLTFPVAIIRGPPLQSTFTSQFFSLEGASILPDCFYENREVIYQWKQLSGTQVKSVTSGRFLVFHPGSFPFHETIRRYKFQLIVTSVVNSNSFSIANVEVQVVPQELTVRIRGGSRIISENMDLVIDALYNDPDRSNASETFYWECSNIATNGLCGFNGDFTLQNASSIRIPRKTLPPGSFSFMVRFAKGGRSVKSERVLINIVASNPPRVSILNEYERVNIDSRIVLIGEVQLVENNNVTNLKYQWSANIPLRPHILLSRTDHKNLIIRPNALLFGIVYEFTLNVTSSDGTGSSSTRVSINQGPRPGQFIVSPTSGTALQTSFSLICSQFTDEDDDLPLRYRFAFFDEMLKQNIMLTSFSQSNRVDISSLPEGFGINNTLTLVAIVSDRHGASTRLSRTVRVVPPVVNTEEQVLDIVRNRLDKQANIPLQDRDLSSTTQLAVSIASLLNRGATGQNSTQQGKCPNNCWNHGVCMASGICMCNRGRAGNDCSSIISEEDIQRRIEIRKSLLASVVEEKNRDERRPINDEEIQQISSTVSVVTSNPYEMDKDTRDVAVDIIETMTESISQSSIDISTSMLRVLSNVMDALDRGLISYHNTSDVVQQTSRRIYNSTDRIWDLISNQMIAGEQATTISTPQISLAAYREYGEFLAGKSIIVDGSDEEDGSSLSQVTLPMSFQGKNSTSSLLDKIPQVTIRMKLFKSPLYYSDIVSNNISTPILSLSIENSTENQKTPDITIRDLEEPFVFELYGSFNISLLNFNRSEAGLSPSCQYWNTENHTWASDGCEVTNISSTSLTCSCTHLTDFSGIIQYVIPQMNILTLEDMALITELNQDNMTTLIVMCCFMAVYILCLSILNLVELFIFFRQKVTKKASETNSPGKEMEFNEKSKFLKILYYIIETMKQKSPWIAAIWLPKREIHVSRQQRITIVYIIVLTVLTSSALMYGTENENEVQTIAASIISSLLTSPFVSIFTFLFKKTGPYKKKEKKLKEGKQEQNFEKKEIHDKIIFNSLLVEGGGKGNEYHMRMEGRNCQLSPDSSPPNSNHSTPRTCISQQSNENVQYKTDINKSSNKQETGMYNDSIPSRYKSYTQLLIHKGDRVIYKIEEMENIIHQDKRAKLFAQIFGLVFFSMLSLCFVGCLYILFQILLPGSFTSLTEIHYWIIAALLIIGYVAIYEMLFIRLKLEKLKRGVFMKTPRVQIAFFLFFEVVFVLCLVGMIALVVLERDDITRQKLIVVAGSILCMVLCIFLWIIMLLKKPKKRKETRETKKKMSIIGNARKIFNPFLKIFYKTYWFPWWFKYIVYLFSTLYIALNSYILVIYGIKFDENRQAPQWIIASFTGLGQDVFIKSPIMFLIEIFLISTILKFIEYIFFSNISNDRNDSPIAAMNTVFVSSEAAREVVGHELSTSDRRNKSPSPPLSPPQSKWLEGESPAPAFGEGNSSVEGCIGRSSPSLILLDRKCESHEEHIPKIIASTNLNTIG